MPQHIAIEPGKLYPQPDYGIAVDREGKWTATKVYLCHRNSITSLMPRPGSPHPEIGFITVDSAIARVTEGDLAEITCHYAGAEPRQGGEDDDDEPKTAVTYSMGVSLSEEPLLSFHRYRALGGKELDAIRQIIGGKDKDDQGNKLRDAIRSDLGREVLSKVERGQTSYYCPRVTWRASWVQDSPVSATNLNKIGNISQPLGPAPALAGGRNWLLNGITQTQEGNSFRIEMEWLASDRGGWDPDMYTN